LTLLRGDHVERYIDEDDIGEGKCCTIRAGSQVTGLMRSSRLTRKGSIRRRKGENASTQRFDPGQPVMRRKVDTDDAVSWPSKIIARTGDRNRDRATNEAQALYADNRELGGQRGFTHNR
jgi:hypothetical protein